MQSVLVFTVISLVAVAPAAAQFGARSGALGGGFASRGMSRPLGGIAGPGFTTGLNSRGNFVGRNGSVRGGSRRSAIGYPYAYSIWVPDSFDYLGYQNQYSSAYYDPGYGVPPPPPAYNNGYNGPPPGPQQPVIINQYFNSPPAGSQAVAPPPGAAGPASDEKPGDLLATPQNYYLIAFKNHSVYPALAYWVEDKTLHYVTTQNTHNQASLDLIDIARSKSLNQDRDVPFSITAQ
jgi:hypothetical protein